jgi:medium-chain acyl-[acyl-carrier-protein] hydrolase
VPPSDASRWVQHFAPQPWASVRLFCFPYAGAGAALFRAWPDELSPEVEVCAVQLPGRENRLAEAPFTRMEPLVESLDQALLPWLDRPFAFYGHSMGALIAFELARTLARARRVGPTHLFVSGCAAPQLPRSAPPIHQLPEPEFVEELRRLKGTPEQILQHAEILQLIIPLLRADMALVETYTLADGGILDCPISALAGEDDSRARPAAVAAWSEQTRGPFRLRILPGDHFFVQRERAQISQAIRDDLQSHTA